MPAMPPLSVLIVEDSPTIRRHLVATLEELAPVRVAAAVDGAADALRLLDAPAPAFDLVIVDLFLAQGSGLDLLHALQQRRSPVQRVVLTNCATPAMRAHSLSLGAARVFDKSGEIEALVDWCEALAAARCGGVLHDARKPADAGAPPSTPQ